MAKSRKTPPVPEGASEEIRLEVNTPPHQVHLVKLSDIKPDPNQPRKHFHQDALNELAENVTKYGVLQAITIRPTESGFYVVFGERRYRAAIQAGLKEIPATIRTLTDDEALEIQIIENLQRKDVHPLEEAYALQALLDKLTKEKHSAPVNEIALRIGKSHKYVNTRLKLNNLYPELQDMFMMDKMSFHQAVLFSRVPFGDQKQICTNRLPKDWKERENWKLPSWAKDWIDGHERELEDAPFDLTDPTLNPEMGSCVNCPYNSSNTLSLFEDDNDGPTCSNVPCFEIKRDKSFVKTLAEASEQPDVVFVAKSYLDSEDQSNINAAEENGINVVYSSDWEDAEPPTQPDWESFYDDNTWEDFETEEEKKEHEEKLRPDFEEAVKEWEEEKAEWAKQLEIGAIKKAFIVGGNGAGTFTYVTLRKSEETEDDATDSNSASQSVNAEIEKINSREKRNKELDVEKVWSAIRTMALADDAKLLVIDTDLHEVERKALAMAIYSSLDYHWKHEFEEILNVKRHADTMKISNAIENITAEQFNILNRMLMISKLFPAYSTHEKSGDNYRGYTVALLHNPTAIKEIELQQQEKAEKRADRVKQRVAALKKSIPSEVKKKPLPGGIAERSIKNLLSEEQLNSIPK